MLNETIETLNKRLIDYFGKDTESERAIWRVVWSDDQFEDQLLQYTPEGIELTYPKWTNVPKYKMMGIKERYILERLVMVPTVNQNELVVKVSYEPMWTFEDANRFPLPPKWEAIRLIIDTVHCAIGHSERAKYPDPDKGKTPEQLVYEKKKEIEEIQLDLFGNETKEMDAVRLKEGIIVPSSYTRGEQK